MTIVNGTASALFLAICAACLLQLSGSLDRSLVGSLDGLLDHTRQARSFPPATMFHGNGKPCKSCH